MQRVEVTERVFGHQRTAIQPHPADHFGGPNRVAGEQRVELRGTQETHHADFHNEVVNQLLRLNFIQHARFDVAFNIDIKEGRSTAQRHRAAVLGFHRCQVAEIEPLYRFLSITRRTGNIKAVLSRHFGNLLQGAAVLGQLFTQTDRGFQIFAAFQSRLQIGKLQFTLANKVCRAVQRHAAVVADDASTAIAVR